MNRLTKILAFFGLMAMLIPSQTISADAPQREHRAIWMTPFLGQNWPSSAITESNASSVKRILENRLEKFRDQNINVVYYHVRSMCDANYESSYEPWSASVGGTRGKAPAFDPFAFLIETAHKNGIEVYAWVNPYRYCSASKYGDAGGDLNYENSHPDWLISQAKETILNPGMEEVKQRIVDVVSEIVTKYDVDGVIFDDYFYTSGTPMTLDATQYNAYKNGGGKLSQADWRRANVNEMVSRVNAAIKAIKPYVAFAISPAGVASPPTVTSEYGLPAAPGGGDWQYNGIYSDPLAWLKAGTIDFISPQIYWPSRFDALTEWWSNAASKFNRHCYPSVTLSDITTHKYAEFAREVESTRQYLPSGASGLVWFHYGDFVNYYEKWDGKNSDFGTILSQDVYNTKSLVPLRPWVKSTAPEMVTNVRSDGKTLTWDANAAARYAVYKVPANQTTISLTLEAIVYTNEYTLPDNGADYTWYVAAYDRYGNITPALGVGAVKQTGSAPQLVYPAEGEKPIDLFEFKWNHESNLKLYTVEVAEDKNFNTVIGSVEAQGMSASVTGLPVLTNGKTYYWRVKATDVNREHPVSETRSFVAPRIELTNPVAASTNLSIHATMTWTAAVEGADYTLEIAKSSDMSNNVHKATVKTTSYTIPPYTLTTGTNYYARVTASLDGCSSSSEIVAFTTENKTDYAVPTLVNPAQNNATLHSNETVKIAQWEGMINVTVQISDSETFPSRGNTSNTTLTGGETETPEMSEIKLTSTKRLEDGSTYYLRARGGYNVTTNGKTTTQYTDYTPVYSFVYDAAAGVENVVNDDNLVWYRGDLLHAGRNADRVEVYDIAGRHVATLAVDAEGYVSLESLEHGAYVVSVGKSVIKIVR